MIKRAICSFSTAAKLDTQSVVRKKAAETFTGSLIKRESLSENLFQYGYTAEQLAGMPDTVRNILSLSNGTSKQERKANISKAIDSLKGHEWDCGSVEVQCSH